MGARVVASSKSNDKYISVDPLVLRSTIDLYNLNYNNDNNNDNGDDNDNSNGDPNNDHPAKR